MSRSGGTRLPVRVAFWLGLAAWINVGAAPALISGERPGVTLGLFVPTRGTGGEVGREVVHAGQHRGRVVEVGRAAVIAGHCPTSLKRVSGAAALRPGNTS